MAKPENTQATSIPATRPGPPPGPKIRFTRATQPHRPGDITDRYPYDSCVRLIAERSAEFVDPKEADDYRRVHEAKVAAEQRRQDEKRRVENERILAQQRMIAGSQDRMIKPADAVTR